MQIFPPLNLCKILIRQHIIYRLVILIDNLHSDVENPTMSKYLIKAL